MRDLVCVFWQAKRKNAPPMFFFEPQNANSLDVDVTHEGGRRYYNWDGGI